MPAHADQGWAALMSTRPWGARIGVEPWTQSSSHLHQVATAIAHLVVVIHSMDGSPWRPAGGAVGAGCRAAHVRLPGAGNAQCHVAPAQQGRQPARHGMA